MNLPEQPTWKTKWFQIIFRHDTKSGRLFDELLLVMILLSVSTVFVDSIPKIHAKYQTPLYFAEWFFTLYSRLNISFASSCLQRKKAMSLVFMVL